MSLKSVLDKFYTKDNVALNCIETLDLEPYDFIIEPSAGNGAFSNQIVDCLAFDIQPEHVNIKQQNFFDLDLSLYKGKTLVIGNPPFGKRNCLSKGFIKHCMDNGVDTIAFVLPTTYRKHTLQRIFNEEYNLVSQTELPHNSFLLDGQDYHVPCVWQIWSKSIIGDDLRCKVFSECNAFELSTRKSGHFFVFGAALNNVLTIDNVSDKNRGYYVTVKSGYNNDVIKDWFINNNWHVRSNSGVSGGVSWFTMSEVYQTYIERFCYD